MQVNKYKKWLGKYRDTDRLDLKIRYDGNVKHKRVVFFRFDEQEIKEFYRLSPEKQNYFLNCIWNYHLSMMD